MSEPFNDAEKKLSDRIEAALAVPENLLAVSPAEIRSFPLSGRPQPAPPAMRAEHLGTMDPRLVKAFLLSIAEDPAVVGIFGDYAGGRGHPLADSIRTAEAADVLELFGAIAPSKASFFIESLGPGTITLLLGDCRMMQIDAFHLIHIGNEPWLYQDRRPLFLRAKKGETCVVRKHAPWWDRLLQNPGPIRTEVVEIAVGDWLHAIEGSSRALARACSAA